ncbi:MAG: D-hexose-6-phosphate mutarotase [Thermoanaerobaculia bacterium]|nr:D-hexose-6-phosphate mutarotase [Thermoanaerobaculia bacterium]
MQIDGLNQRFGVSGRCVFSERSPGITSLLLTSPSSECEIVLQGGHVTRFGRTGEPPLLFLSEKSLFTKGKAIRGGVPLIFPWFGAWQADASKPQHGFARTALWSVEAVDASSADEITCTLRLDSSEETLRHWPHAFSCRYTIAAGRDLRLSLEVRNESDAPFWFEEALHTYLRVGDIDRVGVAGLEKTTYIDKTDGMARKATNSGPLRIEGETDSVFLGTTATCVVHDEALQRRVIVEKTGSQSTVVWNPWSEKARGLSDLGDDEWQRLVCIETANASDDAVTLAPGERHTISARIYAESL